MRTHGRRRAANGAARQILGMAVSLLALAAGMWMVSMALGKSASIALRSVSQGMRVPIPYAVVFGAVLLVIYLVLRRAAKGSLPGPAVPAPPARGMPGTHWTPQVFHDIEWRRFEAVCETLFAQAGFEARTQSHGADGGVDIWLYSRNAQGPAAVVQCKHWHGRPVGVKQVREFYGVMASYNLARGTYATTSGFTDDALRFARENGINSLDGAALLALIGTRTPEQQHALLQVAYQGEYWRPTCASCGIKMVERQREKDGSAFWGCPQYPRCKTTLPMRADGLAPSTPKQA